MSEYMIDNDSYFDADENFLIIDSIIDDNISLFSITNEKKIDNISSNYMNEEFKNKLVILIYPNRFYSTYWFGNAQYYYFIFKYSLYNLDTGEIIAIGKSNKSHLFVGITRQNEKPIILKRHITELIELTAREISRKVSNFFNDYDSVQ
jgi:hypothetical protein